MMLASKISLTILVVGLVVALLAVTTMNNNNNNNNSTTFVARHRAALAVRTVLDDVDADAVTLDSNEPAILGLRHRETTTAGAANSLKKDNVVVETSAENIATDTDTLEILSKDQESETNTDEGSTRGRRYRQRGLWNNGYYPPPPPASKPKPKPQPQPYKPPAPPKPYYWPPAPPPKPYSPPAPKYYYPAPPPPRPACPSGYGVTYYTCSYCPCQWNEHKFSISGCGCGCIKDD